VSTNGWFDYQRRKAGGRPINFDGKWQLNRRIGSPRGIAILGGRGFSFRLISAVHTPSISLMTALRDRILPAQARKRSGYRSRSSFPCPRMVRSGPGTVPQSRTRATAGRPKFGLSRRWGFVYPGVRTDFSRYLSDGPRGEASGKNPLGRSDSNFQHSMRYVGGNASGAALRIDLLDHLHARSDMAEQRIRSRE
jgi:hypothetical protein